MMYWKYQCVDAEIDGRDLKEVFACSLNTKTCKARAQGSVIMKAMLLSLPVV